MTKCPRKSIRPRASSFSRHSSLDIRHFESACPSRDFGSITDVTDLTPRYLVPFHPKRVPHAFTDVLIVGGGLAGLRAAIAVDPKLSVLVVTKGSLQKSNSQYAQGGIASVLDPEDRFEDHIADTLTAGGRLCDREVVEM